MPAGRPTKYKKKFCKDVERLMAEGKSIVNVCAYLDIHWDTFYEWKNKYPEFSESVKKGTMLSEDWWQQQAQDNLKSGNFNSTLWYMNMKNRFGWADKQEVNHSGGVTIQLTKEDAEL